MTIMTEEITIKKENLMRAYSESCNDVKEVFKKIFRDVDFTDARFLTNVRVNIVFLTHGFYFELRNEDGNIGYADAHGLTIEREGLEADAFRMGDKQVWTINKR